MQGETEAIKQQMFFLDEQYMKTFQEQFGLTLREAEVLEKLIATEDGVQEIADELYISRRNLQRYIASIYRKTGTKSRVGLFQTYMALILNDKIIK